MQTEKLSELLEAIKAEAAKTEAGNQAVCPHCGRAISLQPTTPTDKAQAAPPVFGRRRRVDLRSLAMDYARKHFNGDITESYRAVKKGIGSTRGKDKAQIRGAKINWYKAQLAK